MITSLSDNVSLLPFDLQEVISYKLHQLYTREIHQDISVFQDVQYFWKLMKIIVTLCILDYIEEYTHLIFCPFYTSKTGGFERPDMDSFINVMNTQLKIMTSYEHFEEYFKNELRMLFTEKNNAYLWLGPNLQNNAFDHDEISKACDIFLKFWQTQIGSRIPRTMFNKLIVEEQESIRGDILDMYFDPSFQIF